VVGAQRRHEDVEGAIQERVRLGEVGAGRLVLAAAGDSTRGRARFDAGVATVAQRIGASHPEVTELCEEAAHAGIGVAPACHAGQAR